MKKNLFFVLLILVTSNIALSQKRVDQNPVTYEELYDEPYAISSLFVQFQPMYGEMFTANINAGFGLEATYFHKDKLRFNAQARKTYSKKFDLARDIAENIQEDEDNSGLSLAPEVFNYYEFGGTYHIKDSEESSKTKMFLYKKSYKGNKWAARVPIKAEIPCKVRKIIGGRLGYMYYDTSFELNRTLDKQDKSLVDIQTDEGVSLPLTQVNDPSTEFEAYSNVAVGGGYIGGSYTWIRNVAVDFDNNYREGVDDLILTVFADILLAPSVRVDDIMYQGEEYSADAVDTSIFGFRAGIEGRFNRTWSWAYGGEIGVRPGLKGRGVYALIKISFPVFSTNLNYKVEAFGR